VRFGISGARQRLVAELLPVHRDHLDALLAWIALGESITHPAAVTGHDLVFLVPLSTLLEVVLAPLRVWIASSERPAPTAILGGAVAVVAVVLKTTQKTRSLVTLHPIAAPEVGL